MPSPNVDHLLTMKQVMALTGFKSRSTIYGMVERRTLPRPCVVNTRGLRWRESDIREWIDSLETRQ